MPGMKTFKMKEKRRRTPTIEERITDMIANNLPDLQHLSLEYCYLTEGNAFKIC